MYCRTKLVYHGHQHKILTPQFSKAQLKILNLDNFKAVEFKNYCIEVPLNGITSLANSMKINQVVQNLLVGDTQTDTLVI
jgi:hypothetical protein